MARTFVNSSSQYIDCGTSAALAPGTGPFTVGAWIKRSTSSGAVRQVLNYSKASAARYSLHLTTDYRARFLLRNDAAVAANVTAPAAVALNEWHHLVGVRQTSPTGQIRIFVDGIEAATPVAYAATESLSGFTRFFLGYHAEAAATSWDGGLAEAFVCVGHPAAAEEAAALYRGEPPPRVFGDHLTAYWPLPGVLSPEAETVRAINGTLVGAPAFSTHPVLLVPHLIGRRAVRRPATDTQEA